MSRHIKLLALFMMVSVNTVAQAEPYAGINVGGNASVISKTLNYTNTTTSVSDKYNGLRVQVLAGYNFHVFKGMFPSNNDPWILNSDGNTYDSNAINKSKMDDLYFALELDASYNSSDATERISPWFLNYSASVREKQQYNIEIFLLPKYQIYSNVILFLGAGLSGGQLSVNTTTQTAGNLGITGDTSTWLSGWAGKAGIEVPVMEDVSIVVTYQYTYYNSISWTRTEPLTGESLTARYQPTVQSFTFGFNVH